jgi:hypothetical protein
VILEDIRKPVGREVMRRFDHDLGLFRYAEDSTVQ